MNTIWIYTCYATYESGDMLYDDDDIPHIAIGPSEWRDGADGDSEFGYYETPCVPMTPREEA